MMYVLRLSLSFMMIFSISTLSYAGTVTLNWIAPFSNTDQTPLTDLKGFKIYYGTASGNYTWSLDVGLTATPSAPEHHIENLEEGKTYYFAVTAYNSSHRESTFSNEVHKAIPLPDTIPPLLSNISTSSLGSSEVTISWITDEPSDTQIEYGTTVSYGSLTGSANMLVTTHVQPLSGLSPSTRYHFRVRSRDAAGNLAVSQDFSFQTLPPPDTTPPTQSSIEIIDLGATTATIRWETDEPADSAVEYGLSAVYGSRTNPVIATGTMHTHRLTGLIPQTVYHYRISNKDIEGNLIDSGDRTFTTPAMTGITKTLKPAQDTFININTHINGSSPQLNTYTWPDYKIANAILMKFDLSGIPAGATILRSTLHLHLIKSDSTADPAYMISLHKIINKKPDLAKTNGYTYDGVNAWTTNTCCYNHVALAQADISPFYDVQAVDQSPGLKSWDMTSMVQEWVNHPTSNFGLLLNSDSSKLKDRYRTFASLEDPNPALQPYLSVTYTVDKLFPAQDTFLNINHNTNHNSQILGTYTWPDYKIANAILMKFDLSAFPPGSKIESAVLNLYLLQSDPKPEPLYRVSAHKIIQKNPDLERATGYSSNAIEAWTANGCCYNNTPLAQADISPAYVALSVNKIPGYKTWDITSLVQEWIDDPHTNLGLLLNSDPTQGKDHYRIFASKEFAADFRPFLLITLEAGP